MSEDILIGVILLGIAAVLLFLGWPNKSGESPVSYTHLTLPTNREV